MRWTLRIFTALVLVCASVGPVGSAWAAPGNGNDVGQGNGHGQGLQTAPGQTGVQHSNNSSAPSNTSQPTADSHANGNGNADHANGDSADHGNGNTGGGQGQDNGVTGNSGTIKISSDPLSSSSMANQPHPGCTFYILGYGFPTTTGTYWISPQPANGDGPAGSTTSRESPIAYSNGASSPYPVLVQQSGNRYDLQIGPISDFASGQYKVYVNSDGTPGGAKQKVFRLDCPSDSPNSVSETPEAAVSVAGLQTSAPAPSSNESAETSSAPTAESGTTASGESGTVASAASDTATSGENSTASTAENSAGSNGESAPGEEGAVPQAFNAAQPSLQGVNVAGEQISVPAGVPVELNGDTATVTGPAVVMVGSQPEELAPGEVMVLGVQAQQVAPNTGTAGLVATDYVYKVQPGDTLDSIAADYYGDSAYAWSIYRANADALDGSTVLAPGMVLQLP